MEQPTSLLHHELQEILKNSEWPISFEEILVQISPEAAEKASSKHIYSPLIIYNNGKRLFHPAESLQKWFTVEVINNVTIRALFDDGEIMLLDRDIRPAIINRPKLNEIVKHLLDEMDEATKVGELYILRDYFEYLPWNKKEYAITIEEYLVIQNKTNKALSEINHRLLGELCEKLKFKSLCYITNINNLPSILRVGILSNNYAPKDHASFANEEIQKHRHEILPNQNLLFTLHDYVPLFFSSKPPLLYKLKDNNALYVKIHISPDVLLEPGVVFHDMNARSPRKKSFTETSRLAELNWSIIHADFWTDGANEDEKHTNSLYRQAEADIPLRVSLKYFNGIIVFNNDALSFANKIINENGLNIPVLCRSDQYFN